MKQGRQNDRSMLSGPTNDSIPAGRVQAKLARPRLPDLFCVYFAFLLSLQHQRERERYYGIRLAGWEQMERDILGGNTLAVMAHLATGTIALHTQHTHTQRMALLECGSFVSWVRSGLFLCPQALGSVWPGRVSLLFLTFVRVCWAGLLAAFTVADVQDGWGW